MTTTITEAPIRKGSALRLSTSGATDAPEILALSIDMQDIARSYLAARARTGGALLETARHLAAARAAAKHGEWRIFLDATKTSDDTAENLLRIAAEAERDPRFADAVQTGHLLPTVAALYTRDSTPETARARLLETGTPPTATEARRMIQEERPAKSRNVPAFETPPAEPAPDLADAIPDDIRALADSLGLIVEPSRDAEPGVLLYWPHEADDIDGLMAPLSLDAAREWLADDAPKTAMENARQFGWELRPATVAGQQLYACVRGKLSTAQYADEVLAYGDALRMEATQQPTLPATGTLAFYCEECGAENGPHYVNVDGVKIHLCDRCAAARAARAWLAETTATLARCPASTMFRKSEMQMAVDHVRALLARVEEERS